uniref:Uncharacterized protein n=1 Tax=Arundo donax TaxID=35708 RepID=A0A0A9A060_ARUDO
MTVPNKISIVSYLHGIATFFFCKLVLFCHSCKTSEHYTPMSSVD